MEKECLICADKMKGQVIMECGHMCCTTCFAKHSRINNTCPFCRAEFAPPVIKKEKMSLEVAEAMASLTVIESKDLSRELLSTMMSSEQHIAPVVQSRLLQKFDDILLNTAFRAVSNTVHWYDYENPINIQRERSNVFEPYNSNLNYDNDFNEIIQDLQEIAEENHNNRSYGDTMLTAMAEIPILESVAQELEPRFELMEAPAPPPPLTLPNILPEQNLYYYRDVLSDTRDLESLIGDIAEGHRRRPRINNEDVEILNALVQRTQEEEEDPITYNSVRVAIHRRLRRSARIAEQNNRQGE